MASVEGSVEPSSGRSKRRMESTPIISSENAKKRREKSPSSTEAQLPGASSTSSAQGNQESTSSSRKQKYKGKRGKWDRRWDGTRTARPQNPDDENGEKKERLAKRKCALLLGFCGTGYNGMQIQPSQNTKTIEGTLFDALVKAGAISADNSDDPAKVAFSRAARTDSGVHAAGNAVSLKMIMSIPALVDAGIQLVPHLNTLLPPEIRVWDIIRTTNGFNSRISCDSRIYEYLFPSYVLIPPASDSALAATLRRVNGTDSSLAENGSKPMGEHLLPRDIYDTHRASEGDLAILRELATALEGTHNFHNYTVGRDFSDRSAQRFMIKIEIRDPQVYDGIEWISVHVHGQSFMLHQIRKMVGLMMLAARTRTPAQLVPETYGPTKIHIPKAPALGLLLEQPQFGVYNLRLSEETKKEQDVVEAAPASASDNPAPPTSDLPPGDGDINKKGPIDYENYREQIDRFKLEMIYSRMRKVEAESRIFAHWIAFVDAYSGPDFEYLNHKGSIPPSSVVKKGIRKENQFKEYIAREVKEGDGELRLVEGEEGEEDFDIKSAEMEG